MTSQVKAMGIQRSAVRSSLAGATSLRRARDRNNPARVPRPLGRFQRGLAGAAVGSAAETWAVVSAPQVGGLQLALACDFLAIRLFPLP
jgi:hypothetical protein